MMQESGPSIRERVRERYGRIAALPAAHPGETMPVASCCSGTAGGECCGGGSASSGCSSADGPSGIGYTAEDLKDVPGGANLGLGCGNPTALLSLQPGETVLDLGSGGGVDCFIAAKRVGSGGRVIGVDMTPKMLSRARSNAVAAKISNVEFRLGEIEHLPVADRSVDVVISNCVINLLPDKGEVYREIFRVLRHGGRLALSDVVATRPIPEEARNDPEKWAGCSSGALSVDEVTALLASAGFDHILVELTGRGAVPSSLAAQDALGVVPASIRATRPGPA